MGRGRGGSSRGFVLLAALAGCGGGSLNRSTPGGPCLMPDPILVAAVNQEARLENVDALDIRELDAFGASDLHGVECLRNLATLVGGKSGLADLSPLAGDQTLTAVSIEG